MPVLDAKALKIDPKGLSFLRDVLRSGDEARAEKPATLLSRPRLVKAAVASQGSLLR